VHVDKHDDMELPDSAEAGAAGGGVFYYTSCSHAAGCAAWQRAAGLLLGLGHGDKPNTAILSALLPSAGRRAVRRAPHGVACDARRCRLLF
jgi:hypothetical protein